VPHLARLHCLPASNYYKLLRTRCTALIVAMDAYGRRTRSDDGRAATMDVATKDVATKG
jgi:hypothetical protein